MTRKTRKPAQTPPPEPMEPRGERPDQADAPAVSFYRRNFKRFGEDRKSIRPTPSKSKALDQETRSSPPTSRVNSLLRR